MYGDIERQALIGPVRKGGGKDQMGGAGDRQEFGNALEQCQSDDLQPFHRASLAVGYAKRELPCTVA